MLIVIMLSAVYALCCKQPFKLRAIMMSAIMNVECDYAECRYAECYLC
jgi:hypothetical protein